MAVLLFVRLLRPVCKLDEAVLAAEVVAGARAPMPLPTELTAEETVLVALVTVLAAAEVALAAAATPLEMALPMLPKISQWAGLPDKSSNTSTAQPAGSLRPCIVCLWLVGVWWIKELFVLWGPACAVCSNLLSRRSGKRDCCKARWRDTDRGSRCASLCRDEHSSQLSHSLDARTLDMRNPGQAQWSTWKLGS